MELDGIEIEATRIANGTNKLGIDEVIKRLQGDKDKRNETYTYMDRVADSVFLTLFELKTDDLREKFEIINGLNTVIKNYDLFKDQINKVKGDKPKVVYIDEIEK